MTSEKTLTLDVKNLSTNVVDRSGKILFPVLRDVSLQVGRGESLGIVGESGSGKSITALSIMRLLPKAIAVAAGEILLNGRDLLQASDGELRAMRGRDLAIILQDPMTALDPLFTIGSQMIEPLRTHLRLSKAEAYDRAEELLSHVGVPSPKERLSQYPHQMSGGMLQRIVGAIAISCEPSLIIADEPTTALDPTVQAQFLELLEKLSSERNLSTILVTHDFGVAARLCDRICVMYAGRVVETGDIKSIFANAKHPYTRALLSTVASQWGAGRCRLPTIEGQPPSLANPEPGCAFAPRCKQATSHCVTTPPPGREIAPGHFASCWAA